MHLQKSLSVLGVLALCAWGVAGTVAWKLAADGVEIHVGGNETIAEEVNDTVLLRDDIASMRRDVQSLSESLERNVALVLEANERDRESERETMRDARRRTDSGLADMLAALNHLEGRLDEISARTTPVRTGGPEGTGSPDATPEGSPGPLLGAELEPQAVDGPAVEVAQSDPEPDPELEQPARARSFLSFRLPSDDFEADRLRPWDVIPELSRVGFDGRSTIHDFSGATNAVDGRFSVNPEQASDGVSGDVHVTLTALLTGDEDRDEAMFEHLEVETHQDATFRLLALEPSADDPHSASIVGEMTIHGVTRTLTMPVHWSLDDAHRLLVEGEVPLAMSDYGVSVPSKLGVIKVEDEIRLWIALRARPATEIAH